MKAIYKVAFYFISGIKLNTNYDRQTWKMVTTSRAVVRVFTQIKLSFLIETPMKTNMYNYYRNVVLPALLCKQLCAPLPWNVPWANHWPPRELVVFSCLVDTWRNHAESPARLMTTRVSSIVPTAKNMSCCTLLISRKILSFFIRSFKR